MPGADRVAFMAFDLLVFDGRSIMDWPLVDRKLALTKVMTPAPASCLALDHIREEGEAVYQQVLALQLEGMVAKRADSAYQPGVRSPDWVKIKRPGAVPPERFKHAK